MPEEVTIEFGGCLLKLFVIINFKKENTMNYYEVANSNGSVISPRVRAKTEEDAILKVN